LGNGLFLKRHWGNYLTLVTPQVFREKKAAPIPKKEEPFVVLVAHYNRDLVDSKASHTEEITSPANRLSGQNSQKLLA
jgi:hypothetical protein